MLNKAERFRVLKLFRICCLVGLLPVEVDLENWWLKSPSIARKCICFLFGGVLFMHTIYKTGSLAYAYFFDPNVQHHQLVIHTAMASSCVVVVFYYERLFISNPDLFQKYVRMTLVGKIGGLWDPSKERKQNWTTRLREYSLQDLIASSSPCIFALLIPVIVATYVYDPSMRLLVYTALPIHLQTWITYGHCLLEETRLILIIILVAIPVFQLQVISYDLVSNQLQLLMRQIQNGRQNARGIYKVLRSLQIYVSMANNLNGYMIFIWKLHCISVCILAGYSAVAHFHQHPVFGIMYYILLFDLGFTYAVMYDKAFKIPQLFDQAAACALLHNKHGKRTDIFRRQIQSIPRAGIKVKNFHKMERASTPIFIDFVVKNIVNLLVAYR